MSKSQFVAEQYVQRWAKSRKDEETQYIPEKYQLGIITDYLQQHGVVYITEGRVFSYPIDILATRGDTTIAIEMKSKNLSRGIEQAHRNASFVDFSFLAVWEDRINDSLLERTTELPVGLMSVGEGVSVVSRPRKTPQQLYKKDNMLELIKTDVRNNTSV